jgi:hypothetical protein
MKGAKATSHRLKHRGQVSLVDWKHCEPWAATYKLESQRQAPSESLNQTIATTHFLEPEINIVSRLKERDL